MKLTSEQIERQLQYFKEYDITDYEIIDNEIIIYHFLKLDHLTEVPSDFLKETLIKGSLSLDGLTTVPSDFLKGTIIKGSLFLNGLTSVPSDFLKETIINGSLSLNGLTSVPSDFLKETTVNGSLWLDYLSSVPSDFLKGTIIKRCLYLNGLTSVSSGFLHGTVIKGCLYLSNLKSIDKDSFKDTFIHNRIFTESLSKSDRDLLRCNARRLERGYNADYGFCYYDYILNKVYSIKEIDGFTVYNVDTGVVIELNGVTTHGKTFELARRDYIFKTTEQDTSKYKGLDINESKSIDDLYAMYRVITGSCSQGTEMFMLQHQLEIENVKTISDAINLTTNTKAYRAEVFKHFFTK